MKTGIKTMVWSLIVPARKTIALSALAGLIRVCAALGFIAVCKHLIDIATGNAHGSILLFALLMIGCVAVQLCCGSVSTLIENRSEIAMRNSLRSRLYMHVIKGDWIAVGQYHSGDVVARLNDDVTTTSNMICRDLPYAAVTIAQFIGAMVFLLCLDVRLAVVIVVIMPVTLLAGRYYIRKMKGLNMEVRRVESKLAVNVQEGVRNSTLIKAMSGYNTAADEHDALSCRLHQLTLKRTRLSLLSKNLVQGGFAVGYAIAFLFGINGLMNHSITFGVMTAFLQLVNQVQRPTLELSKLIPSIVRTITAAERILELINIPSEKGEEQQSVIVKGKVGVRFEGVSYKYPNAEKFAIENLTCSFPGGSLTAVVGESGAGKTTMFRLLLGLITPTVGRLVIYNDESEHGISASTRENFSYVPQGNTLVSGSIRQNLLMGNPSADEQTIREALKASCAEFVYSLPGGLEFRCEEDGIGLSEGQAQRIAIARGLLHPSRVLLLDEPTSALDFATSGQLLTNLAEMTDGKTIIMITHSAEAAGLCKNKIKLS